MYQYLTKRAFADRLGVTPRTVDGWIYRHWQRGVEYARDKDRRRFDIGGNNQEKQSHK